MAKYSKEKAREKGRKVERSRKAKDAFLKSLPPEVLARSIMHDLEVPDLPLAEREEVKKYRTRNRQKYYENQKKQKESSGD